MILDLQKEEFNGTAENLENVNNLFICFRDELTTCQLRIKMLEKQLEYVDVEIQKEKEAGNV